MINPGKCCPTEALWDVLWRPTEALRKLYSSRHEEATETLWRLYFLTPSGTVEAIRLIVLDCWFF